MHESAAAPSREGQNGYQSTGTWAWSPTRYRSRGARLRGRLRSFALLRAGRCQTGRRRSVRTALPRARAIATTRTGGRKLDSRKGGDTIPATAADAARCCAADRGV